MDIKTDTMTQPMTKKLAITFFGNVIACNCVQLPQCDSGTDSCYCQVMGFLYDPVDIAEPQVRFPDGNGYRFVGMIPVKHRSEIDGDHISRTDEFPPCPAMGKSTPFSGRDNDIK